MIPLLYEVSVYTHKQVRIVDDNENSVFKHDRFLMRVNLEQLISASLVSLGPGYRSEVDKVIQKEKVGLSFPPLGPGSEWILLW